MASFSQETEIQESSAFLTVALTAEKSAFDIVYSIVPVEALLSHIISVLLMLIRGVVSATQGMRTGAG